MNILLTSSGRRSYLVQYFKEALDGEGKVIAANSEECPAFFYADETVITPLIYEEDYIPFLKKYCIEHEIDLIVPLFDIDVPVLAEHKEAFLELGTRAVVSDPEIARICNDKWQTYCFLEGAGIAVPKTVLGLDAAKDSLQSGNLKFPVVVKPRWGMGSIGVLKVSDTKELVGAYSIIEREITESYLRYETDKDGGCAVIVQEALNGQEYGVDIMSNLNCETQCIVVKKKLAMRAGETDAAVIENESHILQTAEQLADLLPHPGNLDVDMFLCDQKAYVLELNARFGGGYPFSHSAGVNLPKALITWQKGDCVDEKCLIPREGHRAYKDLCVRAM